LCEITGGQIKRLNIGKKPFKTHEEEVKNFVKADESKETLVSFIMIKIQSYFT
jgi:prefoldin subunit 5